MRKLYALLLVALAFSSGIANACSCAPWNSLEEHMNAVDAVFIGKVHSTQTNTSVESFFGGATTTFDALEIWKGPTERKIQINHGTEEAACGETFIPNEVVVVFAKFDSEETYYTHQCLMPRYVIPRFGNRPRHPVDVHINEKYIRALRTLPSRTID